MKVPPDISRVLEDFKDVFPDDVRAEPPPDRNIDHRIRLVEGATPPARPTYGMSNAELVELQTQLEDLIKKGFIRPSVSPFAAPVLFAPKPGGGLR